MEETAVGPGPRGGAENEQGGELRARVSAWIAALGLRGLEVRLSGDGRARGVPAVVRCEVDDAVDDVEVRFLDGRRVLIQVKQHLGSDLRAGRPLAKVVDQWVRQCAADGSSDVPLVTVAASATRNVRELAAALDRRRDPFAGALTAGQAAAVNRLREALAGKSSDLIDAVLDRGSVSLVDLTPGRGEAAVAAGYLDGNVVAPAQGEAAFDVLVAAFRKSAAARSGLDLNGWLDALRRAHLDVVVDPQGGRSARRAAVIAAVDRYREALAVEGRTIDLLVFGVELSPIPAVAMTRVSADRLGDDRNNAKLEHAIRRHGRSLLLGPPGSGKTTLLRQLLGAEADRGWVLPLFIDLRALLEPTGLGGRPVRLADTNALDTLVELAVGARPADDRGLLAEAIRSAAGDGSLLVCFDSLDETRQHRWAVASWVRRLVGHLDAGCDTVLASRTSAYASAATLGWNELWVAAPSQAEQIAFGVLEGFAARDGHGDQWVEERLGWLRDAVAAAPRLAETPLLITALAVEAAERGDLDEVPSRATLVEKVVDRVARNWERRSGRVGVEFPPGLHPAQIADALRTSLNHLGWAVVSHASPPFADTVQAQLAAQYELEHGVAPGVARTLAQSCVHFWDEAGTVVLDDHGRLTGRARHVVEVAAARFVAELPPVERAAAVASLASDRTTSEVLALLASLDPDGAADAVEAASACGDRDLLFAVASGARDNRGIASTVADQLVAALSAITASDEAEQAEVICRLAALPAPPADRSRLLSIVDQSLPAPSALVWRALLYHRWEHSEARAACLAVIRAGPPPKAKRRSRRRGLGALGVSDETARAFGEVVLAMASRLRPDDGEIAELIRQLAYYHCPARTSDAVYAELGRRGFRNDRPTDRHDADWQAMAAQDVKADAAFVQLVEHLAGLGGGHRLRVVDRRRLAELSRLLDGLGLGGLQVGELEGTVEAHMDDVIAAADVFLDLGGFDRKVVAAEAASFLHEFRRDRFAWLYLVLDAPRCELAHWDRVDVDSTIAWAVRQFELTHWMAWLGFVVVAQVPESHASIAADAAAAQAEGGLAARHRRLAALAALHTDPDHYLVDWRSHHDPVIRGAVMERADAALDPRALLVEGLLDADVLVRDASVDELSGDDAAHPAVNEALRRARELPDVGTCRFCGRSFVVRTPNCDSCGLALPDPRSKIARLLK